MEEWIEGKVIKREVEGRAYVVMWKKGKVDEGGRRRSRVVKRNERRR